MKPECLLSKSIQIRSVEVEDADFILSLRTNPKYNKYLSFVENNINKQKDWIRKYKLKEEKGEQYYFIIETLKNIPCGTVRVYDITASSFCWGSWILNEDKTRNAAIETAILVYKFGFNVLKLKESVFEVNKCNKKVIDFHIKLGAEQINEDDKNCYFVFSKASYNAAIKKYKKFINHS